MRRIATAILLALPGAALADTPSPSDSQQALYKALAGRHFEAGCGSLSSLSTTLSGDLVWLAENTHQPAWVAIRAADCALALAPTEVDAAARRWLTSDAFKGLALVTVQHLDAMPVPQSTALVEAGLAGPLAAELRPRVARLATPELQALVAP